MANYFDVGEYYPPVEHEKRISRYKENKKLFLGNHYEVFEKHRNNLSDRQRNSLYISVNLASIICKKSADFLFGEAVQVSAGKEDSSNEQKALDKLIEDNNINILNYESALSNAYRGDAFYKVRYGQDYNGVLPSVLDEFKVIVESQNAEFVFPEPSVVDQNKIVAYHVATPVKVGKDEEWLLLVESHYPGRIVYKKFTMFPMNYASNGEVTSWKITQEHKEAYKEIATGVPCPLVVHIPNYALDDSWKGIDDLTEHKALLDEINNRISAIAHILDMHSNPAMAVPTGLLDEDEDGNASFRVAHNKVFEVMAKDDIIPQYITWNGQLIECFKELDTLIELLMMNAEIPAVALGKSDTGTSGSSGLAIKWRMNSLLSKINRKRQYYNKGLKQVLTIAQLLEHAVNDNLEYEITKPRLIFKDGLPKDATEMANIMAIRTGGKPTISQKSAIAIMDDLTEEQTEKEIERIKNSTEDTSFVDASIFNNAPEEQPVK